jgi:hypothetical protein
VRVHPLDAEQLQPGDQKVRKVGKWLQDGIAGLDDLHVDQGTLGALQLCQRFQKPARVH